MGNQIKHMTAVELAALGKFKLNSADRSLIEPGTYDVDTVLSIHGTITVGHDYTQKRTSSMPWQDLFFAALSRMSHPIDREALVRVVESGGLLTVMGGNAEEIHGYEERLLKKTERTCKGRVTATLTAEGITNEAI